MEENDLIGRTCADIIVKAFFHGKIPTNQLNKKTTKQTKTILLSQALARVGETKEHVTPEQPSIAQLDNNENECD